MDTLTVVGAWYGSHAPVVITLGVFGALCYGIWQAHNGRLK